jgi:uncharacterized protein (TIGR00730 family)
MASVCVYCSSSDHIADTYPPVADALGRGLVQQGHRLVYGGGTVGLMGVVARAVHDAGGTVIGVIPERLEAREGLAYELADDLIVTDTMQERKRRMFTEADAFVVLPGGFGTLEEFLEVLTLKQLGYHDRPIVLLNTGGFFDPLLDFFRTLHAERFARANVTEVVHVAATPEAALQHLASTLPVAS